jgi:hypothetical protein
MKKYEGIYQVEIKKFEEVFPEVYETLVEKFEKYYEIIVMKYMEEWKNEGIVKIYVEGEYTDYLPEWPSKQGDDVPWTWDYTEDITEKLEVLKEYREF